MILSFERVIECGQGSSPQCIHDPKGMLRVIYLTDDGLVQCRESYPRLGLYSNLSFKEKGRISPDAGVSFPSLKKVAHHGAFGFWSAGGDHRFVIYMMPTDISTAFQDGTVSFTGGSAVSSFNASFINIHGLLLSKYRALVTPGTKIEIYFSIGNSGETRLGIFHVDRSAISYPDCKLTISGRNTIGKILKEQTFDEETFFDEGSLHQNLTAILDYAEVEDFFVGDDADRGSLQFDSDTTIEEGIHYAISLAPDWKLAETLDGRIGVANRNDARFDQPSVFTFVRDKTCWSYDIEFDDSDAASRVCVTSRGESQDDPEVRAYAEVTFNKWWVQPAHRTKHIRTVDGASLEQVRRLAEEVAASMAISGRIESFVGLFAPQLIIGDEVHMTDEYGPEETIGSVTDIKHSFGKSGFYTAFTVDSGGRKGRTTLKTLIDTVASAPETFIGHKG